MRGALLTLLVALLAAPATRALAADDEPVRPGHWNRGRLPPGWVLLETQHYQVQSQCGKEKAAALGQHLESMLDLYQRFLPMRRSQDDFVLKLFRDRTEFLHYAGEPESSERTAYFDAEHGELVAYDTGVVLGQRDIPAQIGLAVGAADRLTMSERQALDPLFDAITDAYVADTARMVSHEGWHQYLHAFTISTVPMPAWLDEGIGDWFAMATRDANRDATHGYRLGDLNPIRLRTLRRAMANGETVGFQTMLGYDRDQYYLNPNASYAQGWSMVHFLMQHVSKEYRQLIPRLLQDFKDTKNFQQSTATVFDGIDMAALDREWSAWVLRQPLDDPMADLAQQYGAKLRSSDFVADERWLAAYRWYVAHPTALSGPNPEDFPRAADAPPSQAAPAKAPPAEAPPSEPLPIDAAGTLPPPPPDTPETPGEAPRG